MEALLVLPLLGLLLPARYSLRLGGLGIVALMAVAVYGNTPYDPGAGHGLGLAIIGLFVALFFGAIGAGLIARGIWHARRGNPVGPADLAVPPLVEELLIGIAMVVPAGIAAMVLGNVLSGHAQPLAVHLVLLAGLAALAAVAGLRMRGLLRGAVLGLSLWLAAIVADSMRLERQLMSNLQRNVGFCLAIGPDRLPLDEVPPLMGLTAPKPILLVRRAPG